MGADLFAALVYAEGLHDALVADQAGNRGPILRKYVEFLDLGGDFERFQRVTELVEIMFLISDEASRKSANLLAAAHRPGVDPRGET
jgi:hypothetical protein